MEGLIVGDAAERLVDKWDEALVPYYRWILELLQAGVPCLSRDPSKADRQ